MLVMLLQALPPDGLIDWIRLATAIIAFITAVVTGIVKLGQLRHRKGESSKHSTSPDEENKPPMAA